MANKRLKNHVLNASCGMIVGDRGTGKSTLFAFIADTYLHAGYDVYCQYPYKGCYQIPLKTTTVNGVNRYDVDKGWLYSVNLSHCCILIDEARTVWPARAHSKWTVADEDFFNFIRKTDTHLFLATQSYDGVDLNIKRATDETYYLTNGFWHFTHIEASHTTQAKVSDRNTEVIGRMFRKGMQKVSWDICEIPSGNFLFWRRTWYNKFVSTHTLFDKPFVESPKWEEIVDFKTLQSEQGYLDSQTLQERWQAYFRHKTEEQEKADESDDNFLGVDLNAEQLDDDDFDLDFTEAKKKRKVTIIERFKLRKFQNQDTSDLPDLSEVLPQDTNER